MEVKTCSARRLCGGLLGQCFMSEHFYFPKSAHIWGRRVSVRMSVHIRWQPLASLFWGPCRAQFILPVSFYSEFSGSPRGCPHISHTRSLASKVAPPTPSETPEPNNRQGSNIFLDFTSVSGPASAQTAPRRDMSLQLQSPESGEGQLLPSWASNRHVTTKLPITTAICLIPCKGVKHLRIILVRTLGCVRSPT